MGIPLYIFQTDSDQNRNISALLRNQKGSVHTQLVVIALAHIAKNGVSFLFQLGSYCLRIALADIAKNIPFSH